MSGWDHRIDWLRRTTRRISLVEVIVVLVVFVLLCMMMFPAFKRAQVMAEVTKTRVSLSTLTHAVMKYNLENQEEELAVTYVGTDRNKIRIKSYIKKRAKNTINFSSQEEEVPLSLFALPLSSITPIRTLVINEMGESYREASYTVYSDSAEWRTFSFDGRTFGIDSNKIHSSYRGVAPGPLIDMRFEARFRRAIGTPPNVLPPINHIFLYDPSNGTLSHGYLIYEATPERKNRQ